jgi:hypothetical protein
MLQRSSGPIFTLIGAHLSNSQYAALKLLALFSIWAGGAWNVNPNESNLPAADRCNAHAGLG